MSLSSCVLGHMTIILDICTKIFIVIVLISSFMGGFCNLFFLFLFLIGELLEAIKRDFGSFAKFKEKLTAVSVGVQGSGWGWLGFNKEQGRLQIAACSNQDPLQGTTG